MGKFFENLNKTLDNAGEKVSKKATELTAKANLKMEIADTENQLDKKYAELGRKYFAEIKDTSSDELISKIKELESKKSELQKELDDRKK